MTGAFMSGADRHIIQGVALLLVFGARLIEKWRSSATGSGKAHAERWYWTILTTGLMLALGNEFAVAAQERVSAAIQQASAATLDLDETLDRVRGDSSELQALENSVRGLEDARKGLVPYAARANAMTIFVKATHGLAAGQERLAYGRSSQGCRYFIRDGTVQSCRIQKGSQMGRTVRLTQNLGVVRCTDIAVQNLWRKAGVTLRELEDLISGRSAGGFAEGDMLVPLSARPIGYFFLCDYLRNGWSSDSIRLADRAWSLAENCMKEKDTLLGQDMAEKRRVLSLVEAVPAPANDPRLACRETCDAQMD